MGQYPVSGHVAVMHLGRMTCTWGAITTSPAVAELNHGGENPAGIAVRCIEGPAKWRNYF